MNIFKTFFLSICLLFALVLLPIRASSAQGNLDVAVSSPISIVPEQDADGSADSNNFEQGEVLIVIANVFNAGSTPIDSKIDVRVELANFESGALFTLDSGAVTCLTQPDENDTARCSIANLAAAGQPGDSVEIRMRVDTSSFGVNIAGSGLALRIVAEIVDVGIDSEPFNNTGEGFFILTEPIPNYLILDSKIASEAPIRQGNVLEASFTIENDRLVDVSIPTEIEFQIRRKGDRFATVGFPAISCPNCEGFTLASGEQQTVIASILTNFLEPGEYQVRAIVDAGNLVIESNENDNVATLSFVLEAAE